MGVGAGVRVEEGHDGGDVLFYGAVPLDAVRGGGDVHHPIRPILGRERVPGLLRDGAGGAAVVDQLPTIRNDKTGCAFFVAGAIVVGGGGGGGRGVNQVGEVETAPCGERDLPDGAVGEDAEVLDGFAEIEH